MGGQGALGRLPAIRVGPVKLGFDSAQLGFGREAVDDSPDLRRNIAAGGDPLVHKGGEHPSTLGGRPLLQPVERGDGDADEDALQHCLVVAVGVEVRRRVRPQGRRDQPGVVAADRVVDEADRALADLQVRERPEQSAALRCVAIAVQVVELVGGPGTQRGEQQRARGVVDGPRVHVVRVPAGLERVAPDLAAH